MKFITVFVFLLPAVPLLAQETPAANWTGKYAPCERHDDLRSHDHIDIALKISTANAALAKQFENALDFWSRVLDMDWHEVGADEECSMELLDGAPALFDWCVCMSARSQLPDRENFQGWIAFNPRFKLTKDGMFFDAVHEIGHVLGLAHNPDEYSIMFSFGSDERSAWLDDADIEELAQRHALRPGILEARGKKKVVVRLPHHAAGDTHRGL